MLSSGRVLFCSNTSKHFNTACHHALSALKKQIVSVAVAEKYPIENNSKTESLEFQGEFLRLLQEEETNIT